MTTIRPTSDSIRRMAPPLAPFARGPVLGAMTAIAVVLAIVAPLYGYHRDELYFRMLPPAWGYTDQPPLTPLLAHAAIAVFGDSVVALRIVSLLCAAASIALLALITREAGGDRLAQAFTAWGMAGATLTLLFGHVLLTASLDLVVWPATLLCVMRAVLRDDGRWWLVAGAVVGLSSFNKLLIVVLLVGIAAGLAVLGPRRWFATGWLWGAVALAGLIALPNAAFQALNGWPQLAMGAALAEDNAAEVRMMMWPFLILLVGPVLAIFWVTAVVGLLRRPEWRRIRFLVVTFAFVVAFVFGAGTQFYYTAGMLATLTAIGSVSVAAWARTRGRRIFVACPLVLNAAGCAVTSLPLLPAPAFGASGLADINSAAADQVGWERYVTQVELVVEASGADVVIASNYGEAGALDRFGTDLPPVVSGHNALWLLASPPADATTVVIVGGQASRTASLFVTCTVADRLDNGVGVDNEEEGQPITVCSDPVAPLEELWPRFAHLD
jgi:4-amino-4-deoxy-L-arabinose transferase-like glycosyltransferase